MEYTITINLFYILGLLFFAVLQFFSSLSLTSWFNLKILPAYFI